LPDSEQHVKTRAVDVTVCICTYRRSSLHRAIESVAAQALPGTISYRIIVIDNDVGPTALEIVEECRKTTKSDIEYRHAPAQNISIARNAALDATDTPWLAFLDDDEYASRDWLANLMAARHGANAVFGPCEAVYGAQTAEWIRRGDYHSHRLPLGSMGMTTGYTSNALIDTAFARSHALKFDEALGRTGGEDTIFFRAMHHAGGVLRYASDAVVFEEVVPSRAKPDWIVKRKYRAGQIYAMTFRCFDRPVYRRMCFTTPFKVAACGIMSAATVLNSTRCMWWLMRGAYHLGAASYMLGTKVYEEYKS
jgi:succinoglycan biosynthesis protein ExoM